MFRSSRTRFSWLALAVFALNAFWPLVSLANPGGSQAWMEVCTPTGMQPIPSGDTPGEDGGSGIKIPQCPLCAAGSGLDILSTPVLAPQALAVATDLKLLALSFRAARPAAYAPSQPRAPPQFS